MPKLIKKYQAGNLFAMDKSSGYPNTGNAGASEKTYGVLGNLTSAAKSVIGGPSVSTPLDNILPKGGGSPVSLGDLSGIGKGNFLSGIGNFFSNTGNGIFNGLGGTSGILSLGSNIVDSFLPERITSPGVDIANTVLGVASNIPVVGLYALMAKIALNLIDSLGSSKLAEVRKDQGVQDALAGEGGGYGNFMGKWDEASKLSGKRVGLFTGKSALNNKIYEANRLMAMLEGITGKKKTDDTLIALMEDRWNQATMNDLNGGFGNIAFGRLGLKVEILPKVHAILNRPKVVDTLTEFEDVQEFKDGGKMNVIPEGALHARLHHMDNAEGLTKKGIPVVSIAEGGEMELQAEIELNEIIFNLDVTTELEKLIKDGSDNAAIEAGKLLVKEIFENTDDRTGLIKLLEPEKKEPTTEDIVKNHQVFLKGGNLPTLKSIEELVDYAIKQNPAFVLRIGPDMGYAEFIDKEGRKTRGTHYLVTGTDNRGRYLVYPRIQMKDGRLQDLGDKAWEEAKINKNFLVFDNAKDAEKFATEYKKSKLWKPFFDIWEQRYGSYKNGGVLEKINNLSPEQIEKLTNFINSL